MSGRVSVNPISRRIFIINSILNAYNLPRGFSQWITQSVADFLTVHKIFVEKDMISAFFEKRKEVF